jgi:hypothetical protein
MDARRNSPATKARSTRGSGAGHDTQSGVPPSEAFVYGLPLSSLRPLW